MSKRKRDTETLEYMQSMLRELRGMAKDEGRGMAAYLIEMAYLDIGDAIRGVKAGQSKQTAA